MYDTINFRLGNDQARNIDFLAHIPYFLSKVSTHYKPDGQIYLTGGLGSYSVFVNKTGVSLKGSLPKFYLGDNLQTLTKSDSKQAIQKLSDSLQIPVEKAKITRVDLAQNLFVKHDPLAYFNYLNDCRYYKRLVQPTSIYYRNSHRQMIFYDKIKEQKSKGMIIPGIYEDRHTLRYELRFMSHISQQFNMSEVMASHLYTEDFYMNILNRWKEEYFKIRKQNHIKINLETMNSTKQFEKQIFLLGISQLGGESEALKLVDQAKREGVFKHKMQEKRLRDKIKKISKDPDLTCKSELIEELDKKVKESIKFYR